MDTSESQQFGKFVDANGQTVMELIGPGRSTDGLSVALCILTQQLDAKGLGKKAGGFFGGPNGYGVPFENDVFLMTPDYQDAECSCGQSEAGEAWHAANPHAPTCYHAELYDGRLDPGGAFLTALDAACEVRNRLKWHTPEHKAAQADVERAYAAKNAHEDAVRLALQMSHGLTKTAWCDCGQHERCQAWFAEHQHAERCPVEIPNFWHFPTGLKVSWYKYIGRDMKAESVPDPAPSVLDILASCLASIGVVSVEDAYADYHRAEEESAESMKRSAEFACSPEGQTFYREMVDQGVIKVLTFGDQPDDSEG